MLGASQLPGTPAPGYLPGAPFWPPRVSAHMCRDPNTYKHTLIKIISHVLGRKGSGTHFFRWKITWMFTDHTAIKAILYGPFLDICSLLDAKICL